jgi:hypothetical protein
MRIGTIAIRGAGNFGGQSMVALNFYLYGDQASGTVAHESPQWEVLVSKTLPDANRGGQERVSRDSVQRYVKMTRVAGSV